ncbi:MAG: hypothetical protein GX456_05900 [Verrucomicrobia bacterium]|nr:hypothetical protein [Verrucomicrobiota bacterium]
MFDHDLATIDVIVRREGDRYFAFLKDERYPSFDWPTRKTIRMFSDTDAGAFYGLGYATAEDRAFQMTYSLRMVQGHTNPTPEHSPAGDAQTTCLSPYRVYRQESARHFGSGGCNSYL